MALLKNATTLLTEREPHRGGEELQHKPPGMKAEHMNRYKVKTTTIEINVLNDPLRNAEDCLPTSVT